MILTSVIILLQHALLCLSTVSLIHLQEVNVISTVLKIRVNDRFLVTMNWFEGAQIFLKQPNSNLLETSYTECSDIDMGDVELLTKDGTTFMYTSLSWGITKIDVFNISRALETTNATLICDILDTTSTAGASSVYMDYSHSILYVLGTSVGPNYTRFDVRDPSKLVQLPFNAPTPYMEYYNEGASAFAFYNGSLFAGGKYDDIYLGRFFISGNDIYIENIAVPQYCNQIAIYQDNLLCVSEYGLSLVYNITESLIVAQKSYTVANGVATIGKMGCYGADTLIDCYDLSLYAPTAFNLGSVMNGEIQSMAFVNGTLYVASWGWIEVFAVGNWSEWCDPNSPCVNLENDYLRNSLELQKLDAVIIESEIGANLSSANLQVVDVGLDGSSFPITFAVLSLSDGIFIERFSNDTEYIAVSNFTDEDMNENLIRVRSTIAQSSNIVLEATNGWGGVISNISLLVVLNFDLNVASSIASIPYSISKPSQTYLSANDIQSSSKITDVNPFASINSESNMNSQLAALGKSPPTQASPIFFEFYIYIFIAISLILVIILFVVLRRWTKRTRKNTDATTTMTTYSTFQSDALTANTTTFNSLTTYMNTVREMSFPAFLERNPAMMYRQCVPIAEGGMGVVYRAETIDPDLKHEFPQLVVKILKGTSNSHVEAMAQEISIMWFLRDSPFIARIFGFSNNPTALIMKFYEQGTLSDWMKSFVRQKRQMFFLFEDIASGVQVMHNHGIAHCDLKPQNILIEFHALFGRYISVLSDFGIAKVVRGDHLLVQAFNPIFIRGLSVSYASPQLLKSQRSPANLNELESTMNDIYACGIILFQIINGPKIYE